MGKFRMRPVPDIRFPWQPLYDFVTNHLASGTNGKQPV